MRPSAIKISEEFVCSRFFGFLFWEGCPLVWIFGFLFIYFLWWHKLMRDDVYGYSSGAVKDIAGGSNLVQHQISGYKKRQLYAGSYQQLTKNATNDRR